jgi:hypothetical protein
MLARMYVWAERKGYKVDLQSGPQAKRLVLNRRPYKISSHNAMVG